MLEKHNRAGGVGLERLCRQDWVQSSEAEYGVEFFEAQFQGHAYQKHRHDTYAICLMTNGVLAVDYRGNLEISTPGQVVVLHPDEVHDGYAGTEDGFGYRELYVEPALIYEAIQTMCPHPCSLPFIRTPVVMNQKLSAAIISAFESTHEPLAIDNLIMQVADGLLVYRNFSRSRIGFRFVLQFHFCQNQALMATLKNINTKVGFCTVYR